MSRNDIPEVKTNHHEPDTSDNGCGQSRTIEKPTAAMIERAIDYYKDPAAHVLLEVLPNILPTH
jgi:hypothetical protein